VWLSAGVQVTPANREELRAEYQHRQDVYKAEIQRRAVPQVAGQYRFEIVQPCPGTIVEPLLVDLIQEGFEIDIRRGPSAADHLVSGVVTAQTLTLGDGDFSPDTYSFGTIGATGRIELRTFSGSGCTMALTRR